MGAITGTNSYTSLTDATRQAATAGQLITNLPYVLNVFDKATQPTAILLRPAPLRLHSEKGFPQAI
ncbi:hypothetical protein HMPREF3227_01629 [Corynebacterium sp. CMW7794]|nr:hypothetical protein HMPREF0307_01906 [Corynebacterium sp. DNF00584]KXI17405.1 hypothetical protein HMPREF3227_01629 [Corynebacterium sp. CMW7794]OFN42338.1 hypothetical protein HMPREF2559_01625 [Corynebacterium sp. HMSC072G08]OFP19997.1 hypothetical protein HMPREF2998_08120 [Corynebacterium sp. HMSC065A05]